MTALNTYALLTEAQAMAQVGIDVSTDQLREFINGVSKQIEDYLLRKILNQPYTGEIYDWPCDGELILNQPDVTSISLIASSTESVLRASYSGAATHARVEVTETALVTTSRVGATTTTTTSLFSTSPTTTDLASLSISGWTFTLAKNVPSAYLVRSGAQNAKSVTVTLEAWADYDGQYQTDYPAGIIRFDQSASWSNAQIGPPRLRIDYTAGFATVPESVMLVALEMLGQAWGKIGRDTSLASESLGDYAYANFAPQIGTRPDWIAKLDTYRRWLP